MKLFNSNTINTVVFFAVELDLNDFFSQLKFLEFIKISSLFVVVDILVKKRIKYLTVLKITQNK